MCSHDPSLPSMFHEGQWDSSAFCFSFPLSGSVPLSLLIFGWKHSFPPSCCKGPSSSLPAVLCRLTHSPSCLDFAQFHLFQMNKDSTLYALDEQGTLRMNWNITAKYSMSNPIFPSK